MSDRSDHIGAISSGVFGVCLMIFCWGWIENTSRESNYVTVLLALPLMVQLTGLINLYFKPGRIGDRPTSLFYILYLITMFLCIVFYSFLWLQYNWRGGASMLSPEALSKLSVAFIIVLLVIVLTVNFAILMPIDEAGIQPRSGFARGVISCLKDLRTGVLRMPFWALLHFLAVFLSVAYLFAFAYAFHDCSARLTEATPYPPMYRAELPSYRVSEESYREIVAGEPLCFNLYFEEGKTAMIARDGDVEGDIEMGVISKDGKGVDIARIGKNNHDQLNAIVNTIEKLSAKVKVIQLSLIGHANDKKVTQNSYYDSNREVSEERARSAMEEIRKRFHSRTEHKFTCHLLWSIRGISNEPMPRPTNFKEEDCAGYRQDDKKVRVTLEPLIGDPTAPVMASSKPPFKRLALLDYVTFAMLPGGSSDTTLTTSYAKFLSSLSNICQLFFFVGFFNALLSLKDDGRGRTGGTVA